MQRTAPTFWEFVDIPLRGGARLLLLLLGLPLLLSFAFPLWRISMEAPQYPKGLWLDIYAYKMASGNDNHDLVEISNLNHYIGMHAITPDELRDLNWLPFAILAMVLLSFRAALIGNVRTMIDLAMIVGYVLGVAFFRFLYMLWSFGHQLDAKAAFKVEPFMPVVIGSKQIANFTTHSWPQAGAAMLGVFSLGVFGITLFYLWRGRRDAHIVDA